MTGPASWGSVVRNREGKTYKHTRIESSSNSCIDFYRETKSNFHSSQDGQHFSSSLHSKDGGHNKSRNDQDQQGVVVLPPHEEDHNYCRIPARNSEWSSRQGVKEKGSERMEVGSSHFPKDLLGEGKTRNIPVCIKGVDTTQKIFLLETGPHESGNRCFSTELEKSEGICISPLLSNMKGIAKGSQGSSRYSISNSSMAVLSLVPQITSDVCEKPNPVAKTPTSIKEPSRGMPPAKPKRVSSTSGMDSVRENLVTEGISENSTKLILHARREGTLSHYESSWRKFYSWCKGKEVDPFGCPLTSILQFLTDQFKEGLEYKTIAGYRSAISAFHQPLDGCKVGSHPQVSALMKGIFNEKPPKPKYKWIWDVDQVLEYLEKLDTVNLRSLTHKLVMLLALTSASTSLYKVCLYF